MLFGAKKPPKVVENNARILWMSELDKNGELDILVDVSQLPSGKIHTKNENYSIELSSENGQAEVIEAKAFDTGTDKITTILAFDDSASFHRSTLNVFTNSAQKYLTSAVQDEHYVDILISGQTTSSYSEDLSPSDAKRKMDELAKDSKRLEQQNTFLKKFVNDALEDVNKKNPVSNGGVRQIILYSDGLEEGDLTQDDINEIVKKSISYGVKIHFLFVAVTSDLQPDDKDKYDMFQKIAESTGGTLEYFDKTDKTTKLALNNAARKIGEDIPKKVRLKVGFCGAEGEESTFEETLKINISDGSKVEGSSSIEFLQKKDVNTVDPCPCLPECSILEKCVKATCEERFPDWLYWFLGALPFLFGILYWWRKRKPPEPGSTKGPTKGPPPETTTEPSKEPPPETTIEPESEEEKERYSPIYVKLFQDGRSQPHKEYMLTHETLYVGREKEHDNWDTFIVCDVKNQPVEEVSRTHVIIQRDRRRSVYITDKSSNGTITTSPPYNINNRLENNAKTEIDYDCRVYLTNDYYLMVQPPEYKSSYEEEYQTDTEYSAHQNNTVNTQQNSTDENTQQNRTTIKPIRPS